MLRSESYLERKASSRNCQFRKVVRHPTSVGQRWLMSLFYRWNRCSRAAAVRHSASTATWSFSKLCLPYRCSSFCWFPLLVYSHVHSSGIQQSRSQYQEFPTIQPLQTASWETSPTRSRILQKHPSYGPFSSRDVGSWARPLSKSSCDHSPSHG